MCLFVAWCPFSCFLAKQSRKLSALKLAWFVPLTHFLVWVFPEGFHCKWFIARCGQHWSGSGEVRQATGDHSRHYGQGTVGGDGSLGAQGRVEAPAWSSCLRVNPQAGPGS